MITSLSQLVDAAKAQGRKRIAVAYAQDAHTLEAVNDAIKAGIVEATLIGHRKEIQALCEAEGIDPNQFNTIEGGSDVDCVEKAVKMVASGQADVLMKGLVSTDRYMRGILNKEYGLVPPKGVLSHVMVLQTPGFERLIIVSDVAVIPYPDLQQKQAMIRYLIRTANVLGIERPNVACVAPTEQMLAGIPSCVDAALLAKMGDRGQLGKANIDGPLAVDIALFEEVAKVKKITGSSVAGKADCLLFPNIDAGNAFFKACTKLAGGDLAAIVAGTTAPCVLTSRGDSRESKLYSIALACLSAK